MFKKKSARYRTKPRTVFFQGREDDATVSATMATDISKAGQGQKEIYVVPARRRAKSVHAVIQDDTRRTDKVQIIPAKEVKPTFRTPCNFFTVDKIQLKLN